MNVEYWPVAATLPIPLPMTSADISTHLLEDWLPAVPADLSSALMSWPLLLVEVQGSGYLTLRQELAKTERQWKGFVSWMLGIAGTRHVLKGEGYQWIAPASAFYPEATNDVDLSGWHPSFPPSAVTATLPNRPKVRLRPDYLAIRETGSGGFEWAVVESKGTSQRLTLLARCPRHWHRQAENIVVRVAGSVQSVPRHLVVATRVNPNATSVHARRIQVRAWNHSYVSSAPSPELVVEVVAAHLFGLFRNLRLPENARALAAAVSARSQRGIYVSPRDISDTLGQLREAADNELKQRTRYDLASNGSPDDTPLEMGTADIGPVLVHMSPATRMLARKLSLATSVVGAYEAIATAAVEVRKWRERQATTKERGVILPSGLRVSFRDQRG